jgi:hypothetical protein
VRRIPIITFPESGYTKDDVNLMMSDEIRKKHFLQYVKETEISYHGAEDSGKGSAIAGTIAAMGAFACLAGNQLGHSWSWCY